MDQWHWHVLNHVSDVCEQGAPSIPSAGESSEPHDADPAGRGAGRGLREVEVGSRIHTLRVPESISGMITMAWAKHSSSVDLDRQGQSLQVHC